MVDSVGILVEFKAKSDSVNNAFAKIGAQYRKLMGDNDKIGASFNNLAGKATRGANTILNSFLGLGVGLSAVGLTAYFNHVANSIDAVSDTARGLGITGKEFQRLGYAAELSGVSMESVGDSMKRFNVNAGQALNGNETVIASFKKIGVTLDDLKGKSGAEQYLIAANAASKLSNRQEAAAASAEIFGRAYTDALNVGRDGIQKNVKEFDSLGIALTDVQRKAVDGFGDAKSRLFAIFEGFSQKVVADVSPALTEITGDIADFITKSGGIDVLANNVGDKIVLIVQGAARAFGAIIPVVTFLIDKVTYLLDRASALADRTFDEGGLMTDIFNRFKLVGNVLVNAASGNGVTVDPKIVGNYNQSRLTSNEYLEGDQLAGKMNVNTVLAQSVAGITAMQAVTDKTTKDLEKLGSAVTKGTDAISGQLQAFTDKNKNDVLTKVLDIVNKNDSNAGKEYAASGDFEKRAADIIQKVKDGGVSNTAFAALLDDLRRTYRSDLGNGNNVAGYKDVIDEIVKFGQSNGVSEKRQHDLGIGFGNGYIGQNNLSSFPGRSGNMAGDIAAAISKAPYGLLPQKVEVKLSIAPQKDFIIKQLDNSDVQNAIADIASGGLYEAAR